MVLLKKKNEIVKHKYLFSQKSLKNHLAFLVVIKIIYMFLSKDYLYLNYYVYYQLRILFIEIDCKI